MNTAKASVRKLRKVKPSETKNIAISPSFLYWMDLLRAPRAALSAFALALRSLDGGLTISGGEPLVQLAFTRRILAGAKQLGLHTASAFVRLIASLAGAGGAASGRGGRERCGEEGRTDR